MTAEHEPSTPDLVAAMAALPGMGPARLRLLIEACTAAEGWRRIRAGTVREHPAVAAAVRPELATTWQRAAAGVDPLELARRHAASGIAVTVPGEPGYPDALAGDIDAPAVLFHRGDPGVLDAPRVAVVGTRRCTSGGALTARRLGRDLAEAGVVVVSGLALGIDGAAHRGALEAAPGAPPVGVVGNGLDVAYPPRNRDLWEAVAERGLLLGEAPVGAAPAAWRFPARNRIIAALADVVVVVESHDAGGSLHTVEQAAARSIEVMAVPGSVRSPAAAGTNRLIQDGCAPVLSADDVLLAVGLGPGARRVPPPPPPIGDAARVLDAVGGEPATLEHLALRTELPLDRLGLALHALEHGGWIVSSGGWYERGSR